MSAAKKKISIFHALSGLELFIPNYVLSLQTRFWEDLEAANPHIKACFPSSKHPP